MKYFRLNDDVHIPGRWHLGEVVANTPTPANLFGDSPASSGVVLKAAVTQPGIPPDFCLTSFGIPIANEELATAMALVTGRDIQMLPIKIDGAPLNRSFTIPHCLRSVDCLDEKRSEYVKWTNLDHRQDLAGQYRMVTKLVIDRSTIPEAALAFRVRGWPVAMVVSQVVKEAMETAGCVGAIFEDVD